MNTTLDKNRFTDAALQHTASIEAARTEYELAKQRDAKFKKELESAKAEVASILNNREADLTVSIEGLVVAEARVKILEHRLSAGADNSISDRLLELAAAVDEAQGFVSGVANYIAKTIRERRIREIALEVDLPPGKISADEITVRLHRKAVAAERLAVNRISQSADLEKISEVAVFQHTSGILLKLRRLAEFEFEDIQDSSPLPPESVSDSATNIEA
jgi:hypothetical protein